MENAPSSEFLEVHPAESMIVELDGTVVLANASARRALDIDAGSDFFASWSEDAAEVRQVLCRCAGSDGWMPFTLTHASGENSGMPFALRGRGFRGTGDSQPVALLVHDQSRPGPFREQRRLVARLNFELARLRKMEAGLKRALANEEKLHAELIHRVKNNLAILAALVQTRAMATDSEEVRQALEEVGSRIGAIALVHDILDQKEEIDVVRGDELVERLCAVLEDSICPPNISIRRELASYPLHVEDAAPLCLLINELVTNSLKHAFDGDAAGEVRIALRRNGIDKIEVNVSDDGRGFDAENENGGSGRKIVNALAKQLRGDLTVHSSRGTSWQFIFPPIDIDMPEAGGRRASGAHA